MNETSKEDDVVGFGDGSSGKVYKDPKNKKSGGFQGMGLSRSVLRGILKKGYKVPTPIQRKTIPLVVEGRDVVAMARTGSGKTACFLLPLFEKLKTHSTKTGIRAIVLSPTRELALQTLKFLKELGRFTGLRSILLLGGDSMETQFSALHERPDIVVGTPGRFLHICVEMDLSLKDVQYVVFDEADRLFEMGFGEQLREIIQRLPEDRQTVLFSATLPKVLVEFARAGLSDPALIRLDVETKIPDTLELSFVSCRPEEKPAALLCLLNHIVNQDALTIIFAATKHHVEYLHALLTKNGIPNTYIYSDLDPCARKINVARFRLGRDGNNEKDSKNKYKKGKKGRETDRPWSGGGSVRVLIVTDVAARGIDIPHLDYVINYNFPAKVKLFVHRVGRCARAGRAGHALSMVSGDELCYLLDLMLFLGRPLTMATPGKVASDITSIGKVPPLLLEPELSQVNSLHVPESDLDSLRKVSENAYKKYIKCRSGASRESVKRAKELATLPIGDSALFSEISKKEEAKSSLIGEMKNYRPPGTIFEIGTTNKSESYVVMKNKRKMHKNNIVSYHQRVQEMLEEKKATAEKPEIKLELSNSEDIASTFSKIIAGRKRKIPDRNDDDGPKKPRGIDKENFIPYMPSDQHFEQGLAVNNFSREADAVGVDLTGDTKKSMDSGKQRKVWDKKKKRLVTVGGVSKEGKIKSESGAWIPASYKSGRYKDWVEKTKSGHTEEGDSDEEQQVKKRPGNRMTHTHWGKHNLKVEQKKKIGLKRPEQIVKAREQLERKRRRHGRHKKKGKKSR